MANRKSLDQQGIDFSRFPTQAKRISHPEWMLPKPKPPIVGVAGLEKEMAEMLAPLEKQLSEARYPGQQELIQTKIDRIRSLHERAIARARAAENLYAESIKKYEAEQSQLKADMDKVAEEELKALYLRSGGREENFNRDRDSFEQAVIQQKMLSLLSGEPKLPSINL